MMLILLDVDGVCADFSNHLLQSAGSDLTLDDVTRWDIFALMTDDQRWSAKRDLNGSDFWRTLPVMPGAAEAIEEIKRDGHKIVYATSPWPTCEGWAGARYCWLGEHFGIKPLDVIIGSRKSLLHGDVLIDDKPSTIIAWREAHSLGEGWLFDAPYNRDWADLDRVDWPEIVRRLVK